MDDLDRLYNRLVENIRSSYPEYMSRPFEVSELYQTLVPYRHNRRELQIDTNGDYEIALLRLLAGERGYLQGEGTMYDIIKRELATPNPNSAIFREFAARQVSLGTNTPRSSAREENREEPAREQRPAREEPPREQRPTREQAAELPYASEVTPRYQEGTTRAHAPSPRDYSFGGSLGSGAQASAPLSAPMASPSSASAAPAPASPAPSVQASSQTTSAPTARSATSSGVMGGQCRYCSGALPSGRRTVYCPHCGQNLTIQRCPACGTELEIGWKHCITCGRGVSPS